MILKKKITEFLIAGVLLLVCTACRQPAVIYDSSAEDTEMISERMADKGEASESVPMLCVYVCGEVQEPGVYELEPDSRIADAIDAAGGMTENAAQTYLNLAERVTDGQKIEVLSVSEAAEREEAFRQKAKGLVNLNQASEEELMTLTGIGEAKAKDILLYREQHGGFSSIEELMEIPGIKSGVFQKIKDQITI